MRQGVRAWVRNLARRTGSGVERHAPNAVLALLYSSSVAPLLTATAATTDPTALATAGLAGSVGANLLADVVGDAVGRWRSSTAGREPDPDELRDDLATRIEELLDAEDDRSHLLREAMAAVLEEVGAVEEALTEAVERGNAEVRDHLTGALASLAADFAELSGLSSETSRALAAIQEELQGHSQTHQAAAEMARQTWLEVLRLRRDLLSRPSRTRPSSPPGEDAAGRGTAAAVRAALWDGRCPYQGLSSFREEHHDVFFGRDRATEALLAKLAERLAGPSVVVVTGASGVGKSSLLHAGLLPALGRGMLGPGSERWPCLVLAPRAGMASHLATCLEALGLMPAGTLTDELVRHPDRSHHLVERALAAYQRSSGAAASATGGRLIVVVDQFEQVLPQGRHRSGEQGEREAFVSALLTAATEPADALGRPPALLVLGVRGDHWHRCAAVPRLAEVLEDGQFVVEPMTEPELRQAITRPAAVAGLELEAGLTRMVLDDLRSRSVGEGFDVAALPLLSQAMLATWERRQGDRLTVGGYRDSGGVARGVEVSADRAYGLLSDRQQNLAQQLFLRLIVVNQGERFARRRMEVDELVRAVAGERDDVDAVLAAFTDRRLLVRDAAFVEIAHDTLLEAWPRLQEWLRDDLDLLVRYSQLVDRSRTWEAEQRNAAYLYRGHELAAVERLVTRWEPTPDRFPALDEVSRAFVGESRNAERRRRRRSRSVMAILAVGAVTVLMLGSLFVYQRDVARREAAAAASRQLAALASDTVESDPVLSMMAALAAYRSDATPEAERALFRHYVDYGEAETVLSGPSEDIEAIDASHDGRVIAARAGDVVVVWTRGGGGELVSHRVRGEVIDMDLADDGRTLLALGSSRVFAYDPVARSIRWELPRSELAAVDVTVGPDGQAAVLRCPDRSCSQYRVELWRSSGERAPTLVGHISRPWALVPGFGSEPGTVVIASDEDEDTQRVDLWDARTGDVHALANDVRNVRISANGVAVGCAGTTSNPTLTVLDLRRPERAREVPGDASCLSDLAVAPEGGIALVGTTAVDLDTGRAYPQPTLDSGPASLAGRVLVSRDGRDLALNPAGAHVVLTEITRDEESNTWDQVMMTPDGRRLVGVTDDGRSIMVTGLGTDSGDEPLAEAGRPRPHWLSTNPDLTISPDGRLVADRVAPDRVQVRRLEDLGIVSEVRTEPVPDETDEELNPDELRGSGLLFAHGRLVTISGARAEWWDPWSGDKTGELDAEGLGLVDESEREGVSFAPVGSQRVAVAVDSQPGLLVFDIRTDLPVDEMTVGPGVVDMLSQEGSPYVALYQRSGLAEIWDVEQGRRILGPFVGAWNGTELFTGRFLDRPGRFLLADPGRLRWYRTGSLAPERTLELGWGGSEQLLDRQLVSASADGRTVLSATLPAGWLRTLSLEPADWQEAVCAVLSRREFTEQERAALPSGVGDHPVC